MVGIKMVKSSDIILFRENDASLQLTVKQNSSAYDLTGCTLNFYVKRKVTEANTDAIISKSTGSGISAGGTSGIVVITIEDTDTTNLELGYNFVYDVELTTPAGLKYTILRGIFRLRQD